MTKIALICGVSGQDGSYLAKYLLNKGYQVWGASRDADGNNFSNLERLKIRHKVNYVSMTPEDFLSVLSAVRMVNPHEIYFLAGQSSVSLSFQLPGETLQSISIGTLNILEVGRMMDPAPKMYFAGSSESFGDTHGAAATEVTPFKPKSPYAVAKASSFWTVNSYREAYGLFACTGILFNHESPLRPERFVTKKIIAAAQRIAGGSREILELGRLDIKRDWGWAPEYVEAMWLMMQKDQAEDFVISTGELNSLESFVSETFSHFDLDWKDHVRQNPKLMRPSDISVSYGDSTKAKLVLKWCPRIKMRELVTLMISSKV